MKKLLILLTALLLCQGVAQAEDLMGELIWQAEGQITTEELKQAAQADFPDWRLIGDDEWWSDRWEGQMGHHCELYLLRVAEGRMQLRTAYVMLNPVKPGDTVPWEVTDYAPVPLTAEVEARFAAMDAADIFQRYEYNELAQEALPGCAEFLLNEGEHLTQMLIYPDFLVAAVGDDAGHESLRIAHWDGENYTKVTATAMAETVGVVGIHSWNDGLEVWAPYELYVACDENGVWRVRMVTDEGRYYIGTDYLLDFAGEGCFWTNAWYYYGVPTFSTALDGLDFAALPTAVEDAVPLLDASGFACAKADGAPLCDAPDGNVLGTAYARLTGRVVAEQDGWVQLQIGSAAEGMTAWFRAEDLAFGGAVNEVKCTFPSFFMPEDMEENYYEMWLIAQVPGGYLAQLDGEAVRRVSAEEIGPVGPPCDDWGELEEVWWDTEE